MIEWNRDVMGAGAHDVVLFSRLGSTSCPRVDHGGGCKWNRHLV